MVVVGGASVTISPDLTGFRTELVTKMDAILATVHPVVHVGVDMDQAHTELDMLAAKLGGLNRIETGPSVAVQGTDEAHRAIDDVGTHLDSLGTGGGGARRGGIDIARGLGFAGGGLAAFGSLGSLAGFGPEHVALTAAGLAGSLGAGAVGGGLLGLGALGTIGVGAGTDLAGIGQAAGDIKNTTTAMNALNQAIELYGKNSQQAAQAQDQLNIVLAGFSPVAKGAVEQAANVIQQFKTMFDQYTGYAESTGAQLITQAVQTAEKYLPTIGSFAQANMLTIQHGLQGLFTWLGSQKGGLGVFTDLEQIFRSQLPTSIHALTQGIELFLHTVDFAAQETGSFVTKLDAFLTRVNTPTGLEKWHAEIDKLIDDFRMWLSFFEAAIGVVDALFQRDAGTASSIVTTLTQMLDKLHAWIVGTGSATVTNIFTVHKNEILALLALLPPLLHGFSVIYSTLAPPLVNLVTLLAHVATGILNFVGKLENAKGAAGEVTGPLGKLVIQFSALLLVLDRFNELDPTMDFLKKMVENWAASVAGSYKFAGEEVDKQTDKTVLDLQKQGFALAEQAKKYEAEAQASVDANEEIKSSTADMQAVVTQKLILLQQQMAEFGKIGAAAFKQVSDAEYGLLDTTEVVGSGIVVATDEAASGIDLALGSTGVGLIIIGLGIAVEELMSHWKAVMNFITTSVASASDWVVSHWKLVLEVLGAINPVLAVIIVGLAEFVTHWHSALDDAWIFLKGIWQDIEQVFADAWDHIISGVGTAVIAIVTTFNKLPGYVDDVVKDLETPFYWLINHLSIWWGDFENLILKFVNNLPGWLDRAVYYIELPFTTALNFISKLWGDLENVVIDTVNFILRTLNDMVTKAAHILGPLKSFLGLALGHGVEKDITEAQKGTLFGQLSQVQVAGMGATPGGLGISSPNFALVNPANAGLGTTGPFGDKTLGLNVQQFVTDVRSIDNALKLTGPGWADLTKGMTWLTNAQYDQLHAVQYATGGIHGLGEWLRAAHIGPAGPGFGGGAPPGGKAPAGGTPPETFAQMQATQQAINQLATDAASGFAAWKADQTTLLNDTLTGQMTIKAAQLQAATDLSTAANTLKANLSQMAQDVTSALVQHLGDIATIHNDATAAQTTRIGDMSSIQTDRSNAVVTAIQDSTTTQVDKMAEFNQSGLALQIAQNQVRLDQLKATQDAKLASEATKDAQLKLADDNRAAGAQAHLDQVMAHQDQLVNKAQAVLDHTTIVQANNVAQAQRALDIVTEHQDAMVAQVQDNTDNQILIAQGVVNRAQLHADLVALTGNAAQAANAQQVYQIAQNDATKATAIATAQAAAATRAQTAAISPVAAALTAAQNTAAKALQNAQDALATAKDNEAKAVAAATRLHDSITSGNALREQQASNQVSATQNMTNVLEAKLQKQIDIEQAKLQQQGQGLVIHMNVGATSDPLEAAAAVAFRLKVAGIY